MISYVQGAKVLLVDDDEEDCKELNEAFEKINAVDKIKIFKSGRELFNYLNLLPDTSYPSLILLDLYLGTVNGEEILQHLKQDNKFGSIPVIIYSSDIPPFLKERLKNLGATYCYQKVTDPAGAIQFAKALLQFYKENNVAVD
jgi:CheY-like chemotaxis protein